MTITDAGTNGQRCPATKKDGSPCQARAGGSGFCVGHSPGAAEARRKGGAATSRAARATKLLPAKLKPIAEGLETAFFEVHKGRLNHKDASAMATIARSLVLVYQAGETEERLRRLEEICNGSNRSI